MVRDDNDDGEDDGVGDCNGSHASRLYWSIKCSF